MRGSRVRIWKQDPSLVPPGFATILLPTPVRDGPRDDEILVELDGVRIEADSAGDFLFDPQRQQREFDAVHTFAVVRHVVTTYKRALWRLGRDFAWMLGEPLRVLPYAGEGQIGQYVRHSGTLRFHSFVAAEGRFKGERIHTCRSFDIVAHETGHAILDAINRDLQESSQDDADALGEAFADLTVIFSILAQMDECERILVETKGELGCCSTLTRLGEQVGQSRHGRLHGARSLVQAEGEGCAGGPHGRSLILSRAVFCVLHRAWLEELERDPFHPTEMLYLVARDLAEVVVHAYLDFRAEPTLSEMAKQILLAERFPQRKALMVEEFERQGLL